MSASHTAPVSRADGKPHAIDGALNNPNTTQAIICIDSVLRSRFWKDPSALNLCEKDVVFVENLEMEVNNGGFDQFFFNTAGDYAHETVTALERIGAAHTADLVRRAIAAFPDATVPKDQKQRQTVMEQIQATATPIWSELDNAFYEYVDSIEVLVLDYVRENRRHFRD